MDKLIAGFTKQLREAISIGENSKLSASSAPVQNILISGLGGSGIGGTIISELVYNQIRVPVSVNKGYFIPAFVDKSTLVIISSYSGNTEETIQALEQALDKKAKITCITSGGKIEEMAVKNRLDLIKIPGGMPPRACLGYSLVQQLYILSFHGLIPSSFKEDLSSSIALLDKEEKDIQEKARSIAQELEGKIPVIYTTSGYEGIAIRLRQQLNENAKILCWHHVFPEMNHNELVGWTSKNDRLAVLFFRDEDEYERNVARIGISKKIFEKYTPYIIDIFSKGSSPLDKMLYFIHAGDWISYYLAMQRGVDAVEVNVINHLKSELSKI